jgi:hypothetical protein
MFYFQIMDEKMAIWMIFSPKIMKKWHVLGLDWVKF